ncbi:hypothetical protein VIGAN_05002400 [Vigna angularis var. angularis]|uniref:Uncharacterized protein n=2 Tax=Phaseolus angularis TaxID=3914 RepID=A0A0S3S1P8_PHAAN|nr:uncharacterized protein LOC108330769 isoform X2 [Vigna angularis]BAT86721.1 hypothetical protein VIGAN_05002400 [Vigna angularis var. angularis]
MRNGYGRIGSETTHKARSMDHATTPFPQTQKAPPTTTSESPRRVEDGKGEIFGVILGRSASVSTSFSSASGAFEVTMKRAFSMGRSSSVSERYCRIHDTAIASPIEDDDDDEVEGTARSKEDKGVRMKIKILKAYNPRRTSNQLCIPDIIQLKRKAKKI